MLFKKINIHNFRLIKSLVIENIKQVNLITGRNNCGKTSVLEAIFLLTGMSKPQLTLNIHSFRNLVLTEDEGFKYLFKDLDFSKNPTIGGELDSEKRTLEIQAIYPQFAEISPQISGKLQLSKDEFLSNASASTVHGADLEGLRFSFNINGENNFEAEIRLKQGEINLNLSAYDEKLLSCFMNPSTIMMNLDRRLDKIVVRKDLKTIISPLKEIEPNLNDIRVGAGGMIYADIGIDKLVPINVMGDGIRRILAILTAIYESKNGILLIDEVENGLHYRTLSILWRAILKMALDNNVQLFITTHSYECIYAFTQVYQEQKLDIGENFISLFRIGNHRGEHRAFQYEADILLAGIEGEFEVR